MSLGIQAVAATATSDPVLQGWQQQIRLAGEARERESRQRETRPSEARREGGAAPADDRSLIIAGGGTKSFYGQPLRGEILDATAYRGIVTYEPTELVITARGGTPLAEIEALLAEHRQMLAFEPPRFGGRRPGGWSGAVNGATTGTISGTFTGDIAGTAPSIGGVVAAGLAGPRRMAAGAVRDFVLGVRLMNGHGQLLSFGGQVMKNVAGYDVSRLMAGSLGCLGVLAEVSLKVVPQPRRELTLRFELAEGEALERLKRWAGQPLPISASAWHDNVLHLRLSGAEAAIAAGQHKLGGEVLAPELASAYWDSLRDQTQPFFADSGEWADTALIRLALPDTTPPLALPGPQLIEWGGAQRWCRVSCGDLSPPGISAGQQGDSLRLPHRDPLRSSPAGISSGHHGDSLRSPHRDSLRSSHRDSLQSQKIFANATLHGGHATLFRPASNATAEELQMPRFTPLAPPLLRLHRQLKRVFDPAGVFNRGRLFPEL